MYINVALFFLQLDESKEYVYHPPTQSPINPPYKLACELRRTDQLAKPEGATGSSENNYENKDSLEGAVGGLSLNS